MRYIAMVKATPQSESGEGPSPELAANMQTFNEDLAKAGILLAAEGLYPSSYGTRITYSGGKPSVTDGPFAETKELVGGFWLVEVKSREEAIAWFTRVPFDRDEQIELRRIFDADEFMAEMEARAAHAS